MREDSLYSSRRDTPPRPSSAEKAFMARPPEESGGRRGVQEGLKLGFRQPRQNSAFPFLVAPSSAASALVSVAAAASHPPTSRKRGRAAFCNACGGKMALLSFKLLSRMSPRFPLPPMRLWTQN